MENILEAPGLFWWSTTKVPKGYLAPAGAVSGLLTINEAGITRLRLIGLMSKVHDAVGGQFSLDKRLDPALFIHGKLMESKGCVVLGRLIRNGSTIGGFSNEAFVARDCLHFAGEGDPPQVRRFNVQLIDLLGLEEWFHVQGILLKKTRRGYSARIDLPKEMPYELEGAKLFIEHDPLPARKSVEERSVRSARIQQKTSLVLKRRKSHSLEDHRNEFTHVEDLFLLLTGARVSLKAPQLRSNGRTCTYYFERDPAKPVALTWSNSWTSWGKIKQVFGELYEGLRKGREQWGPGLYLYLGTRKLAKNYLENQFVTLIWGLESMHRRTNAQARVVETPLQIKIQRILGQIEMGKDRQWLEKRLRSAAEPSLEERIFELFTELHLPVTSDSLRKFCKECADLRNDISHFGGERRSDYSTFVARLHLIHPLVEMLYHALLLSRIGLQQVHIMGWILNGPHSYGHKSLFRECGLEFDAD